MKNKNLLLLSLFLFLPAATQCMKRPCSQITGLDDNSQQITIQNLKNEHDELKAILKKEAGHWKEIYLMIRGFYPIVKSSIWVYPGRRFYPSFLKSMPSLKPHIYKGYSALGAAMMASAREKHDYMEKNDYQELNFQEKKEFIKGLLACKYIPTEKDKKLAQLVYEKHKSTTSKKRLLLQYSQFLSKMEIPQDIINLISLFILETEELLL